MTPVLSVALLTTAEAAFSILVVQWVAEFLSLGLKALVWYFCHSVTFGQVGISLVFRS